MKFNLSELQDDNVIITNTDEAFADTVLADEPFTIEVKRLKRAEKIDTMSASVDANGNISNGSYSKTLFINSITSVSGMVDENNQPLGLDEGIREIIWEYGSDILVERVKAVIQSFNAVEDKKKEEPESDLETTPIG